MAKIRLYPDPVLRKSCRLVKVINSQIKAIVHDLEVTMHKQKHGIGIAAPQIGKLLQIAIVDVSVRIKTAKKLVIINPEIIACSEPIVSREGCMSLPEYTGNLKRYNRIKLKWTDLDNELREAWFEGIEARCIQHEIDHLNGKLFMDRIVSLKTDMFPRK